MDEHIRLSSREKREIKKRFSYMFRAPPFDSMTVYENNLASAQRKKEAVKETIQRVVMDKMNSLI
jgi:ABC-type transporter Mla maintaining outer membrane lipid asymmetry ATPase subunit MlaF